ncbi:hypothetical protein ACQEVC_45475 [Plantactinospora sp. CA-294935]|uniref:hypothetical protein n=1 Tax=Plantactinospora sp. CA-294935 TaxID=3240012 RepID=UPI003D924EAD
MPTTLVATPEPGNTPPRVLLELEYTGQTEATVSRLDPDGRTRLVRLADPATLSGGLWTGYDYESWLNGEAVYTAITAGGSVTSTPVTLTADRPWLRHPGVPSLSIPIEPVGPLADRVRPVNQAVLQPLGRREPIVVTDARRKSIRSTLRLRTETADEAAALVGITDDASILLLDADADWGLGITHAYLALGDLEETSFRDDYGPHPWRTWSAPYVVVGRPAGGLQSERTYADVLAEHATYADVLAAYDTYSDLLLGTS